VQHPIPGKEQKRDRMKPFEIAHTKPLSREEEQSLTKRYQAGDAAAGERLVRSCMPFVIRIALDYRKWGIPLEDIIQQGNIGLLRALRKFDLAHACRLTTYASYWIRAEIREYVVRGYRVVRLGTTKSERRALRAYRRHGVSDIAQLSEMSGMSTERVTQLLPLLEAREASFDASPDGNSTLLDRFASGASNPEETVTKDQVESVRTAAIARAMIELSDREQLIIRERFLTEDPCTLEALGARLGVSKERVRQLEERARQKLRVKLEPALRTSN
jgi:RNA polymerase sigma-32 factor